MQLFSSLQRFRFCGDLDCPDWVLAEISTLSKLTSVKMKLLCVQVVKKLLGSEIDYDKVSSLTAAAKFETGDVKASLAALTFILSSAAKFNVEDRTLSSELQQLGLPKEHAASLCKTYADKSDELQDEFRRQSLRLSHLEAVDWRVDYVLSSSQLMEVKEPSVQLRLKIRNPDSHQVEPVAFKMTADKFRVFLNGRCS
ncbi:hypothetical protein NP493_307g00001 [Ridgeia piscesae]|uniref:COMM domain-containing protein n=1 Tax=Ridgeia piscesae TaxID=27915 RepID=A0AAD9NV43_RIDPI|nr:hypothetical protein NP493_307g00001 [Ridgeia piscesae]